MANKIRNLEQVTEIADRMKLYGKTIVTTNGSFDILHSAHVHLLQKAKKEGDTLIVLLNSDDSIRRNKGDKRPIVPQDERAKMIASLECVDYVVVFEEDNPLSYLAKIKCDIHVKGGSYMADRMKVEKDLIESWGGQYKTFEMEEGYSTTDLISTILERYGIKTSL